MSTIDTRIDDYILKSAEFAKPILNHLRSVIHKACPDVKETMKWGFPHFEYASSILCSMAAFKKHSAFTFWRGALLPDTDKILAVEEKTSMGHFGPIKSLDDLPTEEIITKYIKEAMALTEKGVKVPKKEKASVPGEIKIPPYFIDALQQNNTALTHFEKLSASHKKEYLEWITEAKTEATRTKRIATTIEWLQEGKSRNWKYM